MTVRINYGGKVNFGKGSKTTIRPPMAAFTAVGGNITTDIAISGVTYRVHRFTSSGILTVTAPTNKTATIEYLVVAGGGGTAGPPNGVGGGGAGGFVNGILTLPGSGEYSITVGSGGAGGSNGVPSTITPRSNPAQIHVLAYGGGCGSNGTFGAVGTPGGSGGGGGADNSTGTVGGISISGQGFPGGNGSGPQLGGGGGGAGGAGNPGLTGRIGGSAKESLISGFPEWFAAGGGGGSPTQGSAIGGSGGSIILGGYNPVYGNSGYINTGSGGGGGYNASGGSGIIIIRYRLT